MNTEKEIKKAIQDLYLQRFGIFPHRVDVEISNGYWSAEVSTGDTMKGKLGEPWLLLVGTGKYYRYPDGFWAITPPARSLP